MAQRLSRKGVKKMKVEIRSDSVEISGYVNVTGRESRVLQSANGPFVEVIKPGAFERSLSRNKGRVMLLNHDKSRILAEQGNGLELKEDAVGLYARATVTDPDVIEKGKRGELIGWSFGFLPIEQKVTEGGEVAHRAISDLDLLEVSVIDTRKLPCYEATSVFVRAEDGAEPDTCYRAEDLGVEVNDVRPKGPGPEWAERIAALER